MGLCLIWPMSPSAVCCRGVFLELYVGFPNAAEMHVSSLSGEVNGITVLSYANMFTVRGIVHPNEPKSELQRVQTEFYPCFVNTCWPWMELLMSRSQGTRTFTEFATRRSAER